MMSQAILGRCDGVESACVIDISGLDAIKTNRLRGELKKRRIRMQVLRNSLARRAFVGGALEPLAKSFAGPCCLVYGDAPATDIARELVRWSREFKVIKLKNGIIEGEPDLFSVEDLSRMKGKRELVAEIAMLISSPARRMASAISSSAAKIAGCLEALIERGEQTEPAA
jgi:large subunit ribosomal protein L10